VKFLEQNYGGSLTRMFARPTAELREQLLVLNGVGPETADSILLYAGQHPVFVVDAYTRRIVARHGILREDAKYEDVRTTFERALAAQASSASTRPSSVSLGGASHRPSRMSLAAREPLAQVFNEMHGLIVGVGKKYCLKSSPRTRCGPRYMSSRDTRPAAGPGDCPDFRPSQRPATSNRFLSRHTGAENNRQHAGHFHCGVRRSFSPYQQGRDSGVGSSQFRDLLRCGRHTEDNCGSFKPQCKN